MAVHLSLEEIVLRALLHGPHCDLFIVQARQNHNGHDRCFAPQTTYRIKSPGVGKRKIQQDGVKLSWLQLCQRRREPLSAIELHGRLGQRFSNQKSVVVIVFDEQNSHGLHPCRDGTLATNTQSSAHCLTESLNLSK